MSAAYFYGCWNEAGHQLWTPAQRFVAGKVELLVPWRRSELDGGLASKDARQPEGVAQLHHSMNWTALAFWDRSVDTRPGSNAVFLFEGIFTSEEVIALAAKTFPAVWGRFKFQVRVDDGV